MSSDPFAWPEDPRVVDLRKRAEDAEARAAAAESALSEQTAAGGDAAEALDYLVSMARGHDYGDDRKISDAEDTLLAALPAPAAHVAPDALTEDEKATLLAVFAGVIYVRDREALFAAVERIVAARTRTPAERAGGEAVAAVLAAHETHRFVMGGWHAKHGAGSPNRYGWSCACGERSPDAYVVYLTVEEADAGRFAHVAAALSTGTAAECPRRCGRNEPCPDPWHDRTAARDEAVVSEWCREEGDFPHGDRCNEPAEFLLWGKLFPPEALGPRCYDHAVKHTHWGMPSRPDQWAVLDLRGLTRAAALSGQPTPEGGGR